MFRKFFNYLVIVAGLVAIIFGLSKFVASAPDLGNTKVEVAELKTYNADTFKVGKDTYQTDFHQKWVNYLSAAGWKTIQTEFIKTSRGFEVFDAPFEALAPDFSDGVAQMVNNNKFDIFTKSEIKEPSLTQTIQALGVAKVAGQIEVGDLGFGQVSYIVYKNAYPSLNADLIYWVFQGSAPEWRKIVRFNSNPNVSADVQLSFNISYDKQMRFVRENSIAWGEAGELKQKGGLTGELRSKKSQRGIAFKPFLIWDSTVPSPKQERKIEKIDVVIKPSGDFKAYKLTKIIPKAFLDSGVYPIFTDTTSTFYPDAGSPGTTSVDGYARRTAVSETFANIRGGAGTLAADISDMSPQIGSSSVVDQFAELRRYILHFDTSSLTSSASISAATISIYGNGASDNSLGSPNYQITAASTASNTTIAASDYANFSDTAFASIAHASWNTAAYNALSLDANGIANISKTGVSKFGFRISWDVANSFTGSWVSSVYTYVQGKSADTTAGTSNDPKLEVTYTIGSSSRRVIIISELFESLSRQLALVK